VGCESAESKFDCYGIWRDKIRMEDDRGRGHSPHLEQLGIHTQLPSKSLNEKVHLGDTSLGGRSRLKWVLAIQFVKR
jgi:hypothetical protein